MRSRIFNYSLVATIMSAFCAQMLISSTTSADNNPYFWDEPAKIKVVTPKKNRVRPQSRAKATSKGEEVAPLLTVKYEVLKRGDGNTQQRVNPNTEFALGDQVKLAITPNQDGFLYVVHNSVDTGSKVIDKSHIIFPDPRINEGENRVKKDQRYVVPGYCQDFSDAGDCWWEITPPNGKEFFTVIFSRDEIADLQSKLTIDDLNNDKAAVNEQIIADLKKETGQRLARADKIEVKSRRTIESDGTYIQNTNRKDNEELIETIELKHLTGDDDNQAIRTRALYTKKRSNGMRVIVTKDGEEVDPSREFRGGDEIKLKFQSNFLGYVYIVNVTPGGKKCLLFPCSNKMVNEVKPSKWYMLPTGDYVITFDEEKGTEVLQVIMSRERINFLDAAIKECCDLTICCEVGETASSAAAELISSTGSPQSGIVAPPVTPNGSSGIRARSITLAPGKDKNKEGSYVAVQDGALEPGQVAVFEIRLKHN